MTMFAHMVVVRESMERGTMEAYLFVKTHADKYMCFPAYVHAIAASYALPFHVHEPMHSQVSIAY